MDGKSMLHVTRLQELNLSAEMNARLDSLDELVISLCRRFPNTECLS